MTRYPMIWFVRHGQTDWNAQRRLQGHRDIDLNPIGLAQAGEAARRLHAVAGDALGQARFVASPLLRARRTMTALRRALALPPEGFDTDDRLKELGFGIWEGLTWAQVRQADPRGATGRDRDRWGFRPAGEGAESYAMLAERVGAFLRELDGPSVVVGHGGTARALLYALGHLDAQAAPRVGIRQGVVLVLDAEGWRWA